MSRVYRKRKEDMNYICPKCKFQWHGDMDSFGKVLIHEKTHKKKGMNQCLSATSVTMSIMISVWEKQVCLHVDVDVSKRKNKRNLRKNLNQYLKTKENFFGNK